MAKTLRALPLDLAGLCARTADFDAHSRNAATELAYRSDEANFNPGPHRVDARRLRVEPFLRSRQITTFGRLANSLGTCEASGFDGGTSRSPAC
ncbi:MAG TPA: hypothetical protein VEQ62_19565, partial [Stellaceae bacterium]|nr:hypothetical protein [Stellaceae bacterium]